MYRKKVVVGLSGGVDSAVAAHLLKEEGYEVIGVTMQMWSDESEEYSESCSSIKAVQDAKEIAGLLGIPWKVLNFQAVFEEKVVSYFISEYEKGRTPNPCNACNRYVKWEALLEAAENLGADYIATGHYASICRLENGRYTIQNSVFASKDQSYALYALTQRQLAHTLMPLGLHDKSWVRETARGLGLFVAEKKDSMEICFIPDKDYAAFIEDRKPGTAREGNFIDANGNAIGRHEGIINYTIGQRRGLKLAMGQRVFVTEIRPESNEVVIGGEEDLKKDTVLVDRVNYMGIDCVREAMRVWAKIRYNHKGGDAVIENAGEGKLLCRFSEAQRAITPGQALVCYQDGHVVCGGIIISAASTAADKEAE